MNFINLNCPPLPYFIVGGGCVYRPGDIHERRTIRNVFDLIYVHSGTLYLEQDPFRVELNAGQFFIITPDTPHRVGRTPPSGQLQEQLEERCQRRRTRLVPRTGTPGTGLREQTQRNQDVREQPGLPDLQF